MESRLNDIVKRLQTTEGVKTNILDKQCAQYLDRIDNLAQFRSRFCYPKNGDLRNADGSLASPEEECIYLATHSMGLQPKATGCNVNNLITDWATRAFEIYKDAELPAQTCDTFGRQELGRLVGADPDSVILMNGLTVNMGLLLLSFYQPNNQRYKILIEENAFPSDRYCVQSIIKLKGHDPDTTLDKFILPPGKLIHQTSDILQKIEEVGSSTAVIVVPAIQFSTGQRFQIDKIVEKAHQNGCLVGVDLAHAVGNIKLNLDEWDVDFAFWCANKYLSGGPGGIGGAYVNKKHYGREYPHLKGWYANKEGTRFNMMEECDDSVGVGAFRMSTPSVVLVSCMLTSLKIFDEATMDKIEKKQYLLTSYLEYLICSLLPIRKYNVEIVTPSDTTQRGSVLSLKLTNPDYVLAELKKRGVVVDLTLGKLMRVCPAPLISTYSDVFQFVETLKIILDQ